MEQAGLSEPPLIYAAENMAGEFLGYAIYHDYDEYSRELGWVLKPAFWHKGYADEMTDLLTALARQEEECRDRMRPRTDRERAHRAQAWLFV